MVCSSSYYSIAVVTLLSRSHSMMVRFERDAQAMKANILTAVVLVIGVVLLGIRYAHEAWTPMRIAGAVIGLPSLLLLLLARVELGGAFSVQPKAQALVTHGLYSRIRNPIYFFGAITIAGFFLYIHRPLALSILVVVVPLQIYRAREEEKILEAKFGEEYRRYRARTWF